MSRIQHSHHRTLLAIIQLHPKELSVFIKGTRVHIVTNRMVICDVF